MSMAIERCWRPGSGTPLELSNHPNITYMRQKEEFVDENSACERETGSVLFALCSF
jgi:hypothetical protein